MTIDTLLFLRDLLNRQSLQVGAPDYREISARVAAALDELDAAIEKASVEPSKVAPA